MIAKTPKPPYFAVIFSSDRTEFDENYDKKSQRMLYLAQQNKGFLGIESARNDLGITISYWTDLNSIQKWKNNLEHIEAQKLGKEIWYKKYKIRSCKVEKDYDLEI